MTVTAEPATRGGASPVPPPTAGSVGGPTRWSARWRLVVCLTIVVGALGWVAVRGLTGSFVYSNKPTITLGGRPVVHFAGWKRHVSMYPAPSGDASYEARVGPYRSGASTVKFPLAKPVPYELVGEIARMLAAEHG